MSNLQIDLDRLLKLRVLVARFGEMDRAKWWNTKGQLGKLGAATLRRGFPRTYRFAQARAVFAVAASRCTEVFDPPNCATLWHLPDEIEERFDAQWEHWLEKATEWETFFELVSEEQGEDLPAILCAHRVVGERELDSFSKLRRVAEGRAVPLPGEFGSRELDISLLALGFGRGETGALAVPYARLT